MSSNSLLPLEDRNFLEKHRFSSTANWLVPGALLVGRYPFMQKGVEAAAGEADLKKIVEAGVTIFVSLQGELPPQLEMPDEGLLDYIPYAAKANNLAGSQLAFLHVPIENFRTPDFQPVTTLIKELQPRLQEGAICYVHCAGGKGRTGTISACLLAGLYGQQAHVAFLRVQKAFETRGKGGSFAESDEQERFVETYVQSLLVD